MSDLGNKIKALKVAALVAMGTATAGNANAQTPSSVTKDDTNTDKIENVQGVYKELDGKQLYDTLNTFTESEEIGRKADCGSSLAYTNRDGEGADRAVWKGKEGEIYIGGTNLHVTKEGVIMEIYTVRKAIKFKDREIPAKKGVRPAVPDNKYLGELPNIVKELSERQKEAKTLDITAMLQKGGYSK